VDEIAVVAGYRFAEVHCVCGPGVDLVHNARYATTNSLYSLWLARDRFADGFVVLNGDVLFHPQLLSDLLTARYDDALLMAARPASELSDEEMKVQVRRGCVTLIDKTVAAVDADGENVGIAKFGCEGAAILLEEMGRIIDAGGTTDWVPRAFSAFIRRRPLHVVESRGYPWIDIDFPEDYWRACSEILPAIEAAAVTPATSASGQLGRALGHV
jgi:choline kinase